eukprot:6200304-Pleurochrysis_carterae.AAC.2
MDTARTPIAITYPYGCIRSFNRLVQSSQSGLTSRCKIRLVGSRERARARRLSATAGRLLFGTVRQKQPCARAVIRSLEAERGALRKYACGASAK